VQNSGIKINIVRYGGIFPREFGHGKGDWHMRDDPVWQAIYQKVLSVLVAVIKKDFDPTKVTPKTRIILDLGAEPDEVTQIPIEYEEAFEIEITEAEYDRFYETVGGHVDYLCRRDDLKI